MAHKEYGVTDITDILRRARAGDSIRRTAKATGLDRKTISNYLRLAAEQGFTPDVTDDQLPEIALGVFRAVHGFNSNEPKNRSCP
jgi:transcriptional regulator with XRE-family HTH domain